MKSLSLPGDVEVPNSRKRKCLLNMSFKRFPCELFLLKPTLNKDTPVMLLALMHSKLHYQQKSLCFITLRAHQKTQQMIKYFLLAVFEGCLAFGSAAGIWHLNFSFCTVEAQTWCSPEDERRNLCLWMVDIIFFFFFSILGFPKSCSQFSG